MLYGLGVTIGAGIYVLVGIAAGQSGMHAPLAFLIAVLVMSFSAASFAELGTRMPVSTSEAADVEKAFNRPWLNLIMGLLVVLTATISAATVSVGSAGYLGVFFDLPDRWIIASVVVSMGLLACAKSRRRCMCSSDRAGCPWQASCPPSGCFFWIWSCNDGRHQTSDDRRSNGARVSGEAGDFPANRTVWWWCRGGGHPSFRS